MAQSQFLSFTALPNGSGPGGVRISVVISPTLTSDDPSATLAAFPVWTNWPDIAARLTFHACFRTAAGSPVQEVALTPVTRFERDGALWTSVFPSTTPVVAEAAAGARTPPSKYDVVGVREAVRGFYADHVGRPKAGHGVGPLDGVKRYTRAELEKGPVHPLVRMSPAQAAFRQLQAFHLPLPDRPAGRLRAFAETVPDFHDVATAVAQYPHLQRRLAFVVDFDLAANQAPVGDNEVAIVAYGAGGLFNGLATQVVSCWTQVRHTPAPAAQDTLFRPRGANGADGFVDLTGAKFEVAIEDIDSAAYHTLDYLERKAKAAASEQPGAIDTSLPALRTKGIQFFNVETDAEIAAAQTRNDTIATQARAAAVAFPPGGTMAGAPVLSRQDLVRGYRIDVCGEDKSRWFSLCDRKSTSTLLKEGRSFNEEGFVSEAVSAANPASGADQKTSQVFFRWNGWSLVVPRPGAAVADDGSVVRKAPSPALPVTDTAIPHTLPKLRFGRAYQFRARETDLAGNSWTLAEAGVSLPARSPPISAAVTFLRHEPVSAPVTIDTKGGAGTTRLVIGLPPDAVSGHKASVLLQPPQSTLDMVVKHGGLDGVAPGAAYDMLDLVGKADSRGETPQLSDPGYHGVVVSESWPKTQTFDPIEISPHLLDIRSPRISLRAYEGDDYQLDLRGGGIVAKAPAGRALAFSIASYIRPSDRALFQTHGGDCVPGAPAYDLIAPKADFVVVHPVEKPLDRPSFGSPVDPEVPLVTVTSRNLGETHAHFGDDAFQVDIESTGRVDITGSWEEVSDVALNGKWPARAPTHVQLFGFDVRLPMGHPLATQDALSVEAGAPLQAQTETPLIDPQRSVYDFRDTKYRRVTLTATAASRFAEFYKPRRDDPLDRFVRRSDPTVVHVRNTKPPKPPIVAYIVPTVGRRGSRKNDRYGEIVTEGWGLRAYLQAGDWFDSGDGEQLAALFAQTGELGSLSQIAGDPILIAAPLVNNLSPSDFSNARSEHANVKQIFDSNHNAAGATPADRVAYDYVSVAAFDVGYDAVKGLLYADLALQRRHAYRPFVRLALARFQPISVQGAHLSSTVLADYIQLTPERSLSIAHGEQGYHLRITGAFPRNDTGSRVRTRLVAIAQSDRCLGGDDQVWRDDGRALFTLQAVDDSLEHFVWTCSLPRSAFQSGGRRRVVIEEWEVWGDPTVADPPTGHPVYAEAVPL
jgi:hypothetical protein